MIVKIYKGKPEKLVKYLTTTLTNVSYANIMKLIRKKDIKINDKRVNKNVVINDGDKIEIYINENMMTSKPLDVVFEDDNIIVVNKKAGIEIQNDNEVDLIAMVRDYLGCEVFACHRLDRNTKGLVIFAKNEDAYKDLYNAFKYRTIKKFYKALVFGNPEKSAVLKAYLKKDEIKKQVFISNDKKSGYIAIETRYKLLSREDDVSLLEVELITGKTHQIRAHLAHVGFPIVGDEKYGDNVKNKQHRKTKQELIAYKLVFKFEKDQKLYYLNNKIIQI